MSDDLKAAALEAVQILRAFPSNQGEVEGRITEKGARMIDSCLDDIEAALNAPSTLALEPVAWTTAENMALLESKGSATVWPTNHGKSTPFALYTHKHAGEGR